MELVDHTDTRHHGSAIGNGKTFANVHLERFQAVFFHHLGGRSPLAFVMYLTFANKTKRDMGQLHQVAAGTHATMHRNERINFAVDELNEQPHHISVHTRPALQHCTKTGNHGRFHVHIVQRLARTRGMTADDIILKVIEILVVNTPLRHRAKACIDAIDNLVRSKLLQKTVTGFHAVHP